MSPIIEKTANLRRKVLAEAINADRSTIAKIENATVGTTLDMLFNIAEALDVEPCKLLEFRD